MQRQPWARAATRHGATGAVLSLALAFVGMPGQAEASCPAPRIQAPALRESVSLGRPLIQWAAVPGASRYRLVLSSRRPEGGVIATLDTLVDGTEFLPPVALATSTAKVTVSVSAICEGTEPAAVEAAHWFHIDLQPGCRLVGVPTVQPLDGRRVVRWPKAAGADRCEVLGYAAFDGRLLFTQETRDSEFTLPASMTGPMAIVVRPRCGAVDGALAYLLN